MQHSLCFIQYGQVYDIVYGPKYMIIDRTFWKSIKSTNGTTCMFLVGRDYTLEKNKIKVEADHFKDILMEEFSDDDHIRKVIMGKVIFPLMGMDHTRGIITYGFSNSRTNFPLRVKMGVQVLPRSSICPQSERQRMGKY